MNNTSQSYFTLGEARTNFFSRMLQELTRGPKVTVLMGKEEKPHIQPKNLLCYYSSFFDNAFTLGFREATERTIRLPECSDMTFKMTVR
jgi:hypothetical protein